MTDQLVKLFSSTPTELVETVVRLTKGEIGPGFEGIELGVAEKLAMKALYLVTLTSQNKIEEELVIKGDIGSAAENLIARKKQAALFYEPLTVKRVFLNLEKIASSEGKTSQDLKLKLVADLLHDASPLEARYITRTVCQKMRLGIADMTQIDALSYLHTPEMEDLSQELKELKLEGLDQIADGINYHFVRPLNDLVESQTRIMEIGLDRETAKMVKEKAVRVKGTVLINREKIVKAYNIHPDLGYIASILSKDGMQGVENVRITPGIPLRAMLGERLPSIPEIIEKMGGQAAFEYKYDGLRVQAHIVNGGKEVRLFSRQLEDITEQFPDVIEYIRSGFFGENAIVEGECVPVERKTGEMLPFQVISQRRGRKYELKEKIEEIPVNLVMFDCLYMNGEEMIDRPYLERRGAIQVAFSDLEDRLVVEKGLSLSKMMVVKEPRDGEKFFGKALDDGCEGIMAKSVDGSSVYKAGSRGWLWIKYKRDYGSEMTDTLDLVVVGAYHGAGRRGGTYGALLMAAYDPRSDNFQTVCKLGSGFNDQHLEVLPKKLSDLRTGGDPSRKVQTKMEADIYFNPFVVLEVKGAEITFSPTHTCAWGEMKEDTGLALRFPRFTGRFREDKGPQDSTTVKEIIQMYKIQVKTL